MQNLDRYWRERGSGSDPHSGHNSCKRASKAWYLQKIAYQYEVNYLFEDTDRMALTNSRKSEGLGNHALYLFGGTDKERCKMKSFHTVYTPFSVSAHSKTEMVAILN